MATCTNAISVGTTSNGPISSGAFTPTANDLLVCIGWGTGTNGSGLTCTSTGNTTAWTQVQTCTFTTAGNGGFGSVWIQNALAAATSTNVTLTYVGDNSTGNHICVYRIAGMSKTGATALLQTARDQSHAAGTPAATGFGAAVQTGNPTIVTVHDEGTAIGYTPPTSWTETATLGERIFSVPSSRAEYAHRDSGFTGTAVTWGTASTGVYGAMLMEFDASAAAADVLFHYPDKSIYA